MTPRRRQRMLFVGVVLAGVTAAAVLAISAIGENMLYFYSPSQIRAGEAPVGHTVRVGGLVATGTVRRPDNGVEVVFDLTDNLNTVSVRYTGILPDLFREGQGVVAIGEIGADGVVSANEVLAKHDENYMPPEVAEALEMAKNGGTVPAFPHGPAK